MKFKYTDFHVHSNWSDDNIEFGPSFEEYVKIAETNKINICFLEHYELISVESDKNHPFYGNKIEKYLEQLDNIKSNYEFVLSGLEVDYYQERETDLRIFIDDYGKELDFIGGTVHEIDYLPVTTRAKLLTLLKKKSIKEVIDNFFVLSEKMINSRIFKNICHLDTIFRYLNINDIAPSESCDCSSERVINLGRLCIKNNTKIEYNLSGIKFPINRSFPSKPVISQLKKEGARIFIGSDSHHIDYFQNKISQVKEAYKYLNLSS